MRTEREIFILILCGLLRSSAVFCGLLRSLRLCVEASPSSQLTLSVVSPGTTLPTQEQF